LNLPGLSDMPTTTEQITQYRSKTDRFAPETQNFVKIVSPDDRRLC
jgi:hypothetical protein